MIKRIELRNFQRHEQLTVCPADGVTVIVGPSHAGKSAIMRAINWVVFNKPAGASFIRHGSESASVAIETDKGTVTRTKSTKGKNEYRIDLPGHDPIILTGFGQNVPSSVVDFFELEEINFQPQMSLPFLICSSGGEVSRKLNQIANLDKIDTTLAELGRISRQVTQGLADARGRMDSAFAVVKSLAWIDAAEAKLVDLEKTATAVRALHTQEAGIIKAVEAFRRATKIPVEEYQQTVAQFKIACEKGVRIQEKAKDRDRLVEAYNQLVEALDKIAVAKAGLAGATARAAETQKIYEDAFPEICPICGSPMRGPNAIHAHS